MPAMEAYQEEFLAALSCAVHGRQRLWTEETAHLLRLRTIRLAAQQCMLPLLAQAVLPAGEETEPFLRQAARGMTVEQAARTGEFLLLYRALDERGLRPAVMKGLICRSLYPEPEQRPSVDEDLLIAPEELPRYDAALSELGLRRLDPSAPLEGAEEVTYVSDERGLYLEFHTSPFSRGSSACGDCCRPLEGALERTVDLRVYGASVRALGETDHLLFLLCHAYKHFLYGGVGVRQLCDCALFAGRYGETIDWQRILSACRELSIAVFAAAIFRIGERHLGLTAPAAFSDIETDELPLLADCLSSGLYGANDPAHLHSSRMTLDAVAAARQGGRAHGRIASLFPPAGSIASSYPYLRRHPWLLPAAWTQRVWRYLKRRDTSPARTLSVGRERIELLRKYGIIP